MRTCQTISRSFLRHPSIINGLIRQEKYLLRFYRANTLRARNYVEISKLKRWEKIQEILLHYNSFQLILLHDDEGLIKRVLPEHYLDFLLDYHLRKPTPVHFVPSPDKYEIVDGMKMRTQNIPIPLRFPVQAADEALWGGEGVVKGFQKKDKYTRRFPRYWIPSVFKELYYSEVLDTYMAVKVTRRAQELIDAAYGLDYYLLKTHPKDVRSGLGMKLKRMMLRRLVNLDFHHDDPARKNEIYNRYKKYLIPEEEIDWHGLMLPDAIQKAKSMLEDVSPKPLKIEYEKQKSERTKYSVFNKVIL